VFENDPVFHASLMLMQRTFIATDRALEAEGVDEPTRDRVAYRLLYDETPCSYPVPDFHEGLDRMRARDERMRQLIEQPPTPRWQP
jgi:hypothetical protein